MAADSSNARPASVPLIRLDLLRLPARLGVHQVLAVILLLVLGWLVLPPLIFLVWTSLTELSGRRTVPVTLENYQAVLSGSQELQVIANSLLFAAGSAVLATALGSILAWLVERTDAPFRRFAYLTAFVSLSVPLVVKVLGWILLLGPEAGVLNLWWANIFGSKLFNVYSIAGLIIVEAVLWTPVSFLLIGPALRALDPSLEDAAAMSGGGAFQTARRVTLPLAAPAVGAVMLLTFINALQSFEVAAMIGMPAKVFILTSRIYVDLKLGANPSYGQASAFAILLMALVMVAFYPYYRATSNAQKFATVTGKGFRQNRISLGRWRPLGGLMLLLLPTLVVLPLLPLLWASLVPFYSAPTVKALSTLSMTSYGVALRDPTILNSIKNSVIVSTSVAVAALFLALLISWLVIRSRNSSARLVDQLATLPLVIPGIVLGLALVRTYLAVPLPVYGTLWILMLGFIPHYLPYATRYTSAGLITIHRELEESAQISGASWWQTLSRIIIPLILPALVAGWIYVFLGSFRQLGLAMLLYGPGTEVVAVTIMNLWNDAQLGEVAAFSVMLSVGLVAIASLVYRVTERFGVRP